MILENEEYILPEHLPAEFSVQHTSAPLAGSSVITIPSGGWTLRKLKRGSSGRRSNSPNGNQTRAARLLNLTRDSLRYRMQKFGLLQEKS